MDIIPDLPNDIARDCLIRLPYKQFPTIASICKAWRLELQLPEFSRRRKSTAHTQNLLIFSQARLDPNRNSGLAKSFTTPVYRVTVLEPDTGDWSELPPIPDLPNGLPMFCQLAAVGLELVVMGGLDPETWETSDSVLFQLRVANGGVGRHAVYGVTSSKWTKVKEGDGFSGHVQAGCQLEI
ncbi:F-box/kelch-repeat protein At1g80440-like [Carica papaya]|uniref:F-box/kelch-repeat protein At1g80440-like n=1 Tax=Carica papaya TaxID=3649 RepID=UPI000B8C76A5|nr:F-box/kelch-repeat protein At1g80440-like [Carica papaya]